MRRLGWAASAGALVAGLAALLLYCFPHTSERTLAPASVSAWGGNAYVSKTGGLASAGDSGASPQRSRLQLLENGQPMGPAHSLHDDIKHKGGGRYSHWGADVVFSTSDNSDPLTNGRTYVARQPVAPAWWLVLLLLAAGLAGVRAFRDPDREPRPWQAALPCYVFWAGVAGLVAYANWAFALLLRAPAFYPDSIGYLLGSILRPFGYGVFLHGFHFVFGNWQHLPLFQLNVLLATVVLLAWALASLTRRYLVGWIFLCLVFGTGTMLVSAADLLTEAPFSAAVLAHLGFMAWYFRTGLARFAVAAGLALAAAVTVKSVAVVLLGATALALLFMRGRRGLLAALVLLPAVLAWLLPSMYNLGRYGAFETSHAGGFAMAGHVAWAIRPTPGDAYAAEAEIARAAVAPLVARRPAKFDGMRQYVDYTANEYNALLWAAIVPALQRYYAERRPSEPCEWDGGQQMCVTTHILSTNRTLAALSRRAIADEPAAYARHVLAHFAGSWREVFSPADLLLGVNHRAEMLHQQYDPARGVWAQALAPLPPFLAHSERQAAIEHYQGSAARRLLDLVTLRPAVDLFLAAADRYSAALLGLALASSLLTFLMARLTPSLQALCYLALCVNAYLLGTALAQPTLVRYAATMQGALAAVLVLVAWAAAAAARSVYDRLRGEPDSPVKATP